MIVDGQTKALDTSIIDLNFTLPPNQK